MPTSRAIPTRRRWRAPWKNSGFFSKELRILGVYPAHPFRLAQNGGITDEHDS
jgi:hypothetical protein